MYRKRAANVIIMMIAIGSSGFMFSACKAKFREGMIISTQVEGKIQNINYVNGDSLGYLPKTRIVAIDPKNSDNPIRVISSDFYSARSPEISYDGNFLLFAAQKNQDDPWQIWEMNLNNSKFRKIISPKENCIDPSYLPGGRLVFSKSVTNDSLKAGYSLFTANLDGTGIKRITFNPSTYFASSVLKDGRVLAISKRLFPDMNDSHLMIMRPDGTKSELFYQTISDFSLSGRAWETATGQVIFIESSKEKNGAGDIISVNYNRPLHSRENLTSGLHGDFHAVFPRQSGNFLVSYRKSDSDRYSLYEFDPVKKVLGQVLITDQGFNELEAVEIRVHERPKKLPSEVDMGVKTGLLMSQNIDLHNAQPSGQASSFPKAANIEIIGIDSLLGVVQPEEDGSFYLKVMADKPFRIKTLDKDGNVIQVCDWIWMRPNERRGCVGCHENQELVPENRIPMAVKKAPVKIPNHITKIVEKQVELE